MIATNEQAQRAFEIRPIGWVESPLIAPEDAPLQGDEGAPEAWIVVQPSLHEAMADIAEGTDVIVITWFHRARRDVLSLHPRGLATNPLTGVFSTRSPDRPNPLGLHTVHVLRVEGTRILVRGLEAIDGTPVVDIKPVLEPIGRR